ncbi:MAG: hypothetical protein U0559_01125 [Anaerolineae bacterium]
MIDLPRPNVMNVWPLSMTTLICLSGQLREHARSDNHQPISVTFRDGRVKQNLNSAGGDTPALTSVVINPIGLAERHAGWFYHREF